MEDELMKEMSDDGLQFHEHRFRKIRALVL